MLKKRIIPCLLLHNGSLVKTRCFNKFNYIGDPVNTIKIFNELEVDELVVLDILATKKQKSIDYVLLNELSTECFMPLSYGGGITNLNEVKEILSIGFEKIILNSVAFFNPSLIKEVSDSFGSQSIVVSIDVRKNFYSQYEVWVNGGSINTNINPIDWAIMVEEYGAGEILLTSINREGTWQGYDIELINSITNSVRIPVIAHGGAGNISHLTEAFNLTNASGLALGSMVCFQKKGNGVLINFPSKNELNTILLRE